MARHLDANGAASLLVEQADVTRPDYAPGMYDLVHARYLFCHLAQREDVLQRHRWSPLVANTAPVRVAEGGVSNPVGRRNGVDVFFS